MIHATIEIIYAAAYIYTEYDTLNCTNSFAADKTRKLENKLIWLHNRVFWLIE